jgi:AcrR family transcriptional regulator
MKADIKDSSLNPSTEEKIKEAARKVFTEKGYAATRTRDIAQEAGLNIALLNYYFRSKEKLYNIIMQETMASFFGGVKHIINNPDTDLLQKLDELVVHYINILQANPGLPFFILSNINQKPHAFLAHHEIKEAFENSKLLQQIKAMRGEQGLNIMPQQIMLNMISMIVFPFIAQHMFMHVNQLSMDTYTQMMEERKLLIPKWIRIMLQEHYKND